MVVSGRLGLLFLPHGPSAAWNEQCAEAGQVTQQRSQNLITSGVGIGFVRKQGARIDSVQKGAPLAFFSYFPIFVAIVVFHLIESN